MVKDRLAEMQAKSAEAQSSPKRKEKNGTPLLSSEEQLTEFLGKVTEMDNKIKIMRDQIQEMDKLQKNILSSAVVNKNEANKLEAISDKIFSSSTQLEKEVRDTRAELGMHKMEATHEKMINNHLNRLNGEITRTVTDLRKTQVEYIEKTKKLHNRKVEIVTGDDNATAEQVDPGNIQALFAGDYFAEAQKARMELREIEARDNEIKKLETSVVEVNRLFKEVNRLVMEQGETLNTIESYVNDASENVEAGNEQLRQAKEYQIKARKKKLCIIGVIVAILLIAAIIIVIVIVGNNNG